MSASKVEITLVRVARSSSGRRLDLARLPGSDRHRLYRISSAKSSNAFQGECAISGWESGESYDAARPATPLAADASSLIRLECLL